MSTGYSGTPLPKKLGLRPGMRIAFAYPPDHLPELLALPPEDYTLLDWQQATHLDFLHAFYTEAVALQADWPLLKAALSKQGSLWISWPKKSSKRLTDLDENKIRDSGLAIGLVDVKVCAVDETWSGLKFVYRLIDR